MAMASASVLPLERALGLVLALALPLAPAVDERRGLILFRPLQRVRKTARRPSAQCRLRSRALRRGIAKQRQIVPASVAYFAEARRPRPNCIVASGAMPNAS